MICLPSQARDLANPFLSDLGKGKGAECKSAGFSGSALQSWTLKTSTQQHSCHYMSEKAGKDSYTFSGFKMNLYFTNTTISRYTQKL